MLELGSESVCVSSSFTARSCKFVREFISTYLHRRIYIPRYRIGKEGRSFMCDCRKQVDVSRSLALLHETRIRPESEFGRVDHVTEKTCVSHFFNHVQAWSLPETGSRFYDGTVLYVPRLFRLDKSVRWIV